MLNKPNTSHRDFWEAAQVLESLLGRAEFIGALAQCLQFDQLTPSMRARLLLLNSLPLRAVLTTNFDSVLGGMCASIDDAVPTESIVRGSADAIQRATLKRVLGNLEAYRDRSATATDAAPPLRLDALAEITVKLHGDVARNCAVVFTREDYRRLLFGTANYSQFLRTILGTRTVLFLGSSLTDEYLNELRSEVLSVLRGSRAPGAPLEQPVAYAVMENVPPHTQAFYRAHEGVHVLNYDTKNGTDFSGFDRWLEAINERTAPLPRMARLLHAKRIAVVGYARITDADWLLGAIVPADRLVRIHTASEWAVQHANAPFDLVITRFSDDVATNVLNAMNRQANRRAPVIVFASDTDVSNRRRLVMALGAVQYCFSFTSLLRAISDVFDDNVSL